MTMTRLIAAFYLVLVAALPALAEPVLPRLLADIRVESHVSGADAFGPKRDDQPVVPVLRAGQTIGWASITSDFVATTGYSGKPIHRLVALDLQAKVIGVQLVKHSGPIVPICIPDAKMKAPASGYLGLDLVAEAQSGGSSHDLDIISGGTATMMVIDDSIMRAGLKVARALGLGGLAPAAAEAGPGFDFDPDSQAPNDWMAL